MIRRPRAIARRPRGALRHYAGLLTPDAAAAAPVLFERDVDLRLKRLRDAARDGARQRLRPSRERMRSLQAAPGLKLRWRNVPAPALPGPEGAVVRPIAVATCDIDCPLVFGAIQMPLPLHLGHECVAKVVAVGAEVRKVKPGERVVVPFEINCGRCPACEAGLTGSCVSVPPVSAYGMGVATGHWGGAFSDLLAVPYADAMLLPLPEGVDPAAAASVADNVCDAYRHFVPHLPQLLQRDADAEVLILGAQRRDLLFGASVPLYAALIALALGARNVCLADARPRVRRIAESLGVEAVDERALRRRRPAPLVVDVSVEDLRLALSMTAPDGVCSSSGSLHRRAVVPTLAMYVRNVSLHFGRTHARAVMPEVLRLIQEGRLKTEGVISTLAALDEAPIVLEEHFRAGGVKAVLTV